MTALDLVPGEFVKVAVHHRLLAFTGSEQVHTVWWFARYITSVDRQIIIEDATGNRCLVDNTQVFTLDHVVTSNESAS